MEHGEVSPQVLVAFNTLPFPQTILPGDLVGRFFIECRAPLAAPEELENVDVTTLLNVLYEIDDEFRPAAGSWTNEGVYVPAKHDGGRIWDLWWPPHTSTRGAGTPPPPPPRVGASTDGSSSAVRAPAAAAASSSGQCDPTLYVNHHCPDAPAANASAFCNVKSPGVSLRFMSRRRAARP